MTASTIEVQQVGRTFVHLKLVLEDPTVGDRDVRTIGEPLNWSAMAPHPFSPPPTHPSVSLPGSDVADCLPHPELSVEKFYQLLSQLEQAQGQLEDILL